jgi:hypothetical protein
MTTVPVSFQRRAIETVLDKLQPDSGLHDIVRGTRVQKTLADFETADGVAGDAQKRYRTWGRSGLMATALGVLVGSILLLPFKWMELDGVRTAGSVLQTTALIVTYGAMLVVMWRRPLEHWMSNRAEAETLRGRIFKIALSDPTPSGIDAVKLAKAKLVLLREAYIDDQLAFFEKRAGELNRAASKFTPLRMLAYLLFGVAIVIGAASLGKWSGVALPPVVAQGVGLILSIEAHRWQLGLTTIGSGLLAYATASALMDESARKAALYTVTAKKLRALLHRQWPEALAGADLGDDAALMRLYEAARTILEQEHAVWSFIRERDDETPGQP